MDEKYKAEFAPDHEITDFCYELVRKVAGAQMSFLSNESSLYLYSYKQPGFKWDPKKDRAYWMKRIEEVYGIDISDVDDKDLNVAILSSELERRLEWQKIQEQS